jgi:very-short-patch-repair endonuclease
MCGKKLGWGDKFCSRECKSLSQVKRITLFCLGCGKKFQIRPYLKRKANFCSLECYRDVTRTKEIRLCSVCGKKFIATGSQIRKGFGLFCSRKCQHETYPEQIKKTCPQCNKIYYVPPSLAKKRTFCSKKCQDNSMRDYVKSVCKKCGKTFELPRGDLKRGRGNFCTYRCYLTYRGPSTLEEKMERALNLAGIRFEREIKFKRFHVDFLLRGLKTVIECDGEFWHLRSINQERDKRKDELLKDLGYKVLRFTGKTMDKFSEEQLANNVINLL